MHSDEFNDLIEEYLNEVQLSESSNFDISEIEQKFEYYSQNKLNINNVDLTEIVQLPLVDIKVAKYLLKNKPYNTKSELNKVILKIRKHRIVRFILANCLAVNTVEEDNFNMNYRARNRTITQNIDGFENNNFKGSMLDLYQRVDATYKQVNINAVIDKDIGERSIADFNSFSAIYNPESFKLIAGDYNVSLGMGDMFDMGFLNTKNANFSNTAQAYGYGFAVNRSTIENNFFRGAAIEYRANISNYLGLNTRAFYSNKNRPANIDESGFVSSIYSSGYFRTDNEIDKKNNLKETIYGTNLELSSDDYGIGITTAGFNYSKELLTSSFSTIRGKQGVMKGAYGYYIYKNFTLMSEYVNDINNNSSFRINISEIDDDIEYLIEFRISDSEFRSPFSNNFGEQSFWSNEKGLISGFKYKSDIIDISLFADYYESDVKTFQLSKPLRGVEVFSLFEFDLNGVNMNLRFTQEVRSDRLNLNRYDGKITFPSNRSRVRISINDYLGDGIDFKSRLEIISYTNEYEKNRYGYLSFLELRKKFENFQIGGRYTLFNTDDFDSAIYTYQYMTPGLSYVYAFYNKGSHLNSYMKYKLIDELSLTLRLDYLNKINEDKIGSGPMEVDSNSRTNLFFQLDYSIN